VSLPRRSLDENLAQRLEDDHKIHPILSRFLSARFANNRGELELRLSPSFSKLKGVRSARHFDHFLDVVRSARSEKTPVLLFGDYDVDGICATFILYCVFRALGVKCAYYLPSRFNEGYGLNKRVITQAKDAGYKLLFALDCGTTNFEEVQLAQSLGINVYILDHHTPLKEAEKLQAPEVPIINPHLEDSLSPLCSTGIAFLLGRELSQELAGSADFVDETLLEFVPIAVIADVAPLLGDNYLLSHLGWQKITQTNNIGLKTLLEQLKLLECEVLSHRDVAFSLVPTVNAAGRMAHARYAIELLLANEKLEAENLARTIMKLNKLRKENQDRLFYEACQQAQAFSEAKVLVLYDKNWSQGLTGVVAARIAETFKKPTLVLCDIDSEEGIAVMSGRAPAEVDLLATVTFSARLFSKLGGHAQAIGGSLEARMVTELRDTLWDAEVVFTENLKSAKAYDSLASVDELCSLTVSDFLSFYPFGEGYPPPRLLVNKCRLLQKSTVGYDSTHLSLLIGDDDSGNTLRLIGFKRSHLEPDLNVGSHYDIGLELELDTFRGASRIMLRLLEVLPTSS